ncbi:epoxide hydrolase 1-like [Asterias rubens]|uniref:epoxide hydrolase 1-like n=1 Tax=Asterias rubens TaxID=7604 RepID=UPI001455022D|nr:epoxide hydrolase 1-like [Asterias rubens]XP_033640541.1 epoxide hydrolase 1-like [Asterias rubens]XP_033640542.1 epoxide hydrolase 1-like [Asterias rubens]XP_033640543.1 epoxide hydrolase 1-like [Asterias rubens]XP_033640544.1 epoxide hydrolase 1-like [Asterias rubens]
MALMLVAVGVLSAGVLIVYLSGAFRRSSGPPRNIVPVLDGWWGRGKKPEEEEHAAIREFKLEISAEELEDLNDRLRKARWFESVEETKFHFGIKPEYMKSIQEYWLNEYDWRKQEKRLNKYPQFKTNIEGIDIHFVRATPSKLKPGQRAKPIMMVHGWPGSFYEFFKIIPMLIDPTNHGGTDADVFEVICPSLPGYGFSEAAHKQGLNVREIGRIFHKLMLRLGFESYYLQGGDWGSMVIDQTAGMFPKHVRGMHSNFTSQLAPLSQVVLGKLVPSLVLDDESYGKFLPSWSRIVFGLKEFGYLHLNATKPDTIGHALTDSPVGLAAYIIEKFSVWTNYGWIDLDDGGLDGYWSKDDLLNNVMIYWVSGCITSSLRLYKETIPKSSELKKFINTVPTGLADLPNDLNRSQRNWAARHFSNIITYRTYPTGGHFAALEVPELLAEDVRNFVQKVEELYPEVMSSES